VSSINFPNNPGIGTIFTNVASGFSYQWDGYVWNSYSPASVTNIAYVDDIASSFDGITQNFSLFLDGVPVRPASPEALLVSIGGVVQEPNIDYTISDNIITFSTPPEPGLFFFAVSYGSAFNITQFSLANGVATEGDFNVSGRLNITGVTSTAGGLNGAQGADLSRLRVTGITTLGNTTSSGVITATSFSGSGVSLTGIVTSIIAGSGISITQSTGIVTISSNGGSTSQWVSTAAGIHTLSSVGIGTTNPTSKLTVLGDGRFTGIVTASAFSPSTGYIKAADGTNSIYIFSSTGNVSFQGNISVNQINTGSGYKALDFDGTTTPFVNITNGLNVGTAGTVITAKSDGFVGIGTTNPTSNLTVRGGDISVGINTSQGLILTSPNGTKYRLFVENDGTLKTVAV
jgi:hypothetical protein